MMNTPFESRLVSADASRDTSRPGSPDRESNRDSGNSFVKRQSEKVRGLASAMLQVSQMLASKYFKAPLGEDEKEKKKRLKEEEKRKKEAGENPDVVVCETKEVLTPQQEWENSLMSSTSYAQLFVHLTTLESSIIWSKSILNTKCRICRRKNDPEHMLLCDECDRGHHLYCLKPKLKSIPSGDWFCQDCKPKERVKSPKKKPRRVFTAPEPEPEPEPGAESEAEASEDEDEEDEPETNANSSEDEEAAEDADDDDEEPEPEEETPPRRTKKSKRSVDPPKKAKKSSIPPAPPASSSKKGLSHLLGKRKSAAQASEQIARFTQEETASGNSSAAESANGANDIEDAKAERQSTRLRGRSSKTPASESAKQLKEQRLSAESGLSKARAGSNKRRRAGLDEELLNMYNPSALEDLLNNMMKHKDGWPFDRPITRSDAPDYFEIIKKPIDLGTVRTNLLHMKYSCNQEVLVDVRLVFQNCYRYNAEEAEEFQCALRLEKYFEKTTRKLGLVEVDDDLENQPLSKKSRKTL